MKTKIIGYSAGIVLLIVAIIVSLFIYDKLIGTSNTEIYNLGAQSNQKALVEALYSTIQKCGSDLVISSTTLSVSCK
jgi:uncharacterized SAM-binding protein YcdF (DUF218 family)